MSKPDWISALPAEHQDEALFDWNERAAVIEYCGETTREIAEALASVAVCERYRRAHET